MNIVFYSNCQFAGLQFFLDRYYTSQKRDVVFHHLENYTMIKEATPIDSDVLKGADVFIYQPIHLRHGIYSTSYKGDDGIMAALRPDCIRIAFPYIYNDALWAIVPPAEIDKLVGDFGASKVYLNAGVVEELVADGVHWAGIRKAFRKGDIDFQYEERFQRSLSILREKEKDCDVTVADYIEENVRIRRLFFTQNHPSAYLFIHCVNQILELLGEHFSFCEEHYGPQIANFENSAWPACSNDLRHWDFRFSGLKKNNRFYERHLEIIYQQALHKHIHPLGYAIPEERFDQNKHKKTKVFADLIPGDSSTYIYKTRKTYDEMYREAMFGFTYRKGGWDCLRHYEILANQCVPYFLGLEDCPDQCLSEFPKQSVLECMQALENGTLDEDRYQDYMLQIFNHARKQLTCKSLANRFLNLMLSRPGKPSTADHAVKVLMINMGGLNFSREMLSVGLRRVLGERFVDYPRNEHLYTTSEFFFADPCQDIPPDDRRGVKGKIDTHHYDLIVIGSIDTQDRFRLNSIPYWAKIVKRYARNEIAFIFGGDRSPFSGSDRERGHDNLNACLEYGQCFAREFGDYGVSSTEQSWDEYVAQCIRDWTLMMNEAVDLKRKYSDVVPFQRMHHE